MSAADVKRIRAGLYEVHGVYVKSVVVQSGTNRRNSKYKTYETLWHAYKYYDAEDGSVIGLVGKDYGVYEFGTLREAKLALAPRPGKLGTHSSATFQVLGDIRVDGSVLVRSDMDDRCLNWQPAKVWKMRDDGFLYLEFR